MPSDMQPHFPATACQGARAKSSRIPGSQRPARQLLRADSQARVSKAGTLIAAHPGSQPETDRQLASPAIPGPLGQDRRRTDRRVPGTGDEDPDVTRRTPANEALPETAHQASDLLVQEFQLHIVARHPAPAARTVRPQEELSRIPGTKPS